MCAAVDRSWPSARRAIVPTPSLRPRVHRGSLAHEQEDRHRERPRTARRSAGTPPADRSRHRARRTTRAAGTTRAPRRSRIRPRGRTPAPGAPRARRWRAAGRTSTSASWNAKIASPATTSATVTESMVPSRAVAAMQVAVNAARNGRRRPTWSLIAPTAGITSTSTRPTTNPITPDVPVGAVVLLDHPLVEVLGDHREGEDRVREVVQRPRDDGGGGHPEKTRSQARRLSRSWCVRGHERRSPSSKYALTYSACTHARKGAPASAQIRR